MSGEQPFEAVVMLSHLPHLRSSDGSRFMCLCDSSSVLCVCDYVQLLPLCSEPDLSFSHNVRLELTKPEWDFVSQSSVPLMFRV